MTFQTLSIIEHSISGLNFSITNKMTKPAEVTHPRHCKKRERERVIALNQYEKSDSVLAVLADRLWDQTVNTSVMIDWPAGPLTGGNLNNTLTQTTPTSPTSRLTINNILHFIIIQT